MMLLRYGPTIMKRTPTVAVLPLISSSGVLEDDILGNALAADINLRLSSIKGFKLLGNSSVMALKNISADLNKSINQAGYNYILSGTISRLGDSRIINVRLIDSSNNVIFENNFAKDPNKLIDLSSDVCRGLANKLGVKLEDDLLLRSPTFDQTAYLMYLRGLELLNRKTLSSYNNAQELFDQAASADNGFADAFAMSGLVSVAKI
jgi:TolB-like protein